MPSGQHFENHTDGETELSPSQILERVKPDHIAITKPDEDRRRRTIIVEKRNGSYGFTLQSYGIHYKKEQEIEMITYVDHVDYDGPAFRAGMREGDVILSINGHDMEKVDHKSLVNFIKSCDSRMRMVVLFEDCVRKVELHMRYIQLQRALQAKTDELERLCVKERELLTGKWKTHSLPARKKTANASKTDDYESKVVTDNEENYLKRPTLSTEDVAAHSNHQHRTHLLITYQHQPPYYIDSRGRAYYLHPTNTPTSSKEYLVSVRSGGNYTPNQRSTSSQCSSHSRRDSQYSRHSNSSITEINNNDNNNNNNSTSSNKDVRKHNSVSVETGCHSQNGRGVSGGGKNALNNDSGKGEENRNKINRSRSYHRHICGGCLAANSPQDNVSLEAYDLASSPCCNSRCVPIARRRRSRSQHQHKIKSSSSRSSLQTQSSATMKDTSEGYSNRSTQANITGGAYRNPHQYHHHRHPPRDHYHQYQKSSRFVSGRHIGGYDQSYTNLLSQCSLHSYTSSEMGPNTVSQIIDDNDDDNDGTTTALAADTGDQSIASYATTSLSSDTLYWDQQNSGASNSSRPITRKNSSSMRSSSSSFRDCQQDGDSSPGSLVKPVKSCDNLMTIKHYANYQQDQNQNQNQHDKTGNEPFVYEYLKNNCCGIGGTSEKSASTGSVKTFSSNRNLCQQQLQQQNHHHHHHQRSYARLVKDKEPSNVTNIITTAVKSSESLLFYSPNLSDASLNQEYDDKKDDSTTSSTFVSNENRRFVAFISNSYSDRYGEDIRYENSNQRDKASQTDGNKKLVDIQQIPEITRL